MFETTKIILKNNTRDFISKVKDTPILYIFFSVMMLASILLFSFVTLYFQIVETNFELKIEDVFYLVFFAMMIKSSYDFYKYFINSNELSYALSTQIEQKKTIAEIFISVFLTNLFIWFVFSTLYILGLILFNININYPELYLIFNIGVIIAICLGVTISINFFSLFRARLIPTAILLGFYFYLRDPIFVVLSLPIAFLHIYWSLNHSKESHNNIRRKERVSGRSNVKTRKVIWAIFHKESTILWRDKLLMSFISTSAFTGLGAGYLYLYGNEIFIPQSLREMYGDFLPQMFVFLGVLIVVIYTAVFPSLTLFLNEEKTMWIIRHIPVKNNTLLFGKASTLLLCFLTSIPFIPFILIFIGSENLAFVIWFLIFSYIIGVIIALPIGVKYVGKKSDTMLLYSVTMILLIVLGISSFGAVYIWKYIDYPILISVFIILLEFVFLYVSFKISDRLLRLKNPSVF